MACSFGRAAAQLRALTRRQLRARARGVRRLWWILVCACELRPALPAQAVTLGGQRVEPALLASGRQVYGRYCQACHGPDGNGQGALGVHQDPPAGDLTRGIIKYASVPAGSLPTDDDLRQAIVTGLRGTAMLGWTLDAPELVAVIAYLKWLAPRWRDEAAGTPIARPPDPWPTPAEAALRGEALFQCRAGCVQCHAKRPCTLKAPGRVYQTLAAGVGGTKMPTWQGALPEADLWALVHYVEAAGSDCL